jgi:cell division protein FtsQ
MMRWFLKNKSARPTGPRTNQWRGSRAEQAKSQSTEARRAKTGARWRRLVRWSGLLAGAAFVGWVALMGVTYSAPALQRLFEIRSVAVEGVQHLTKQEVLDLVKLKPGTALHHIVTTAIKERVESHPWVQEAVVTRVPFHELRISVIERKPAAIVRAGSENYLSDATGHILARLGQTDNESLPLVVGLDPIGLQRGDGSVRQSIISGIELAKLVGHSYEGRMQVSAASPSHLVASVRGVRFQFGEESLVDQWERFQRVKPTLKTLDFDGQGRGASEVDLRFENRIIVREKG